MKKWIEMKNEIAEQKKGSQRRFGGYTQTSKEHEIELELLRLFTLARHFKRAIGAWWFRLNVRQIYLKLFLKRVL
jgi:hypothetical protein